MTDRPPRVRVTSPRTGAPRTTRVSISTQIEQHTRVGDIYVASLMRVQLRQALRVLCLVLLTIGALPVVFELFPGLAGRIVLGVPLPWVVLAFAVYPFLFACGWWFTRRAEAHERTFVQMVRPDSDGSSATDPARGS